MEPHQPRMARLCCASERARCTNHLPHCRGRPHRRPPAGPRWALALGSVQGTPARTVRLPAAAAGAILPTLELSGIRDHTLLGSSGALVHLIYLTFGDTEPRSSAPTSHPLPPGPVCTPDTPSPPGQRRPLSQVNRIVRIVTTLPLGPVITALSHASASDRVNVCRTGAPERPGQGEGRGAQKGLSEDVHPPPPHRGAPEEKRLSMAPGEPTTALPCSRRTALRGDSLTTAVAQRRQEQGPGTRPPDAGAQPGAGAEGPLLCAPGSPSAKRRRRPRQAAEGRETVCVCVWHE